MKSLGQRNESRQRPNRDIYITLEKTIEREIRFDSHSYDLILYCILIINLI